MEFGPDGIITNDLGFITQTQKVFSVDEVTIPEDTSSLVAVAVRYGLVCCGNGNFVKVFQTSGLLSESEPFPMAIIDAGNPVTHISASCDGLTLLVIVLHEDKPKALFYDSRALLSGNESPLPFAAKSLNGAGIQALAWNPRDPSSVAVATSPEDLSIITLEDTRLDTKSKAIKARALSWSPKGKQLTVGLADGTLSLFKPDLQLVRNVKCPPLDGGSSVQSLTWFSNTEFFIGYKLESEEGGQVLMYVNAPKAQEPRFVAYEFICNDNTGPLPPMFYQTFLQEWNTLYLTSSRAAQLGVLGATEDGSGWCEYELKEGRQAVMHCINVTETTYALGMAIDFTSQKIFSHKDGSTSGPYPVIYVLSTGGELNIFHVVNSRAGVDPLVSPPEALPRTGLRTLEQYQGSSSPLPSSQKQTFAPTSSGSMFSGHFQNKQSRQFDPHSCKRLLDIIAKYQYLGSQLEEVNTQLYLEFVSFTEANRNKNDDVLANVEKTLGELQLSPTAYISPVKMLSQGKQEKLQKILSQRTTIPVSTTSQGGGSLFSSSSFNLGNNNGGGGFFSGLGSKPNEENANKNIFGTTSFTSAKPQLNLFGGGGQASRGLFEAGQASTNSFGAGQTNTAPAFGSTGFLGTDTSGNSGATAIQSGFNMTTPQKSPGFGGNATFGGSAVFGGAPSFGSSPKFGSSPQFGGTSTFGAVGGTGTGGFSKFASTPGTTFGAVASSGSAGGGFGSFSGQNTSTTFGGIAQQSPQQTPFGGSGNTFGGGSSFSSWR